MRVGVLALQGDVREHTEMIEHLGATVVAVRAPNDVDHIDALVLPGGESTTISLLLELTELREPLRDWVHTDRPTLGTCAGLVLLADSVIDGRDDQVGLGGLDITVQRNGFGRQRFSFEACVRGADDDRPYDAVFIRAPRIVSVGEDVKILGWLANPDGGPDDPVVVRQGRLIGCSFHPELASDDSLHRLLLAAAEV